MKYYLLAICTLLSTIATAQQTSPYSRFGLGQIVENEPVHLLGMGHLSTAYTDSVHTNIANPATLGNKEFSSIDVGFNLSYHSLKDQDEAQDVVSGGPMYLSYSFPVNNAKTWGFGLGARSFSTKDYSVTAPITNNEYFVNYEGEGNTYNLFLQTGAELFDNFTLGVDGGIFFGTLKDETYNNFLSTGANGSGRRLQQKIRGFAMSVGSQYTATIGQDLDFTLGANYNLESDLNNTQTSETFLFDIVSIDQLEDGTIEVLQRSEFGNEVETTKNENFILPSEFSIGGFLSKKEKWSLGVDAKFGAWEDFQGANDANSIQYQNSMEFSLGGSFIPKYRNPDKGYEAFEYRYGGYYKQTNLNIEGESINDYGFTLGTSFPINQNRPGERVRRIPSNIDFAINVGQKGTLDQDLVQDSYIKGILGMNLNDIWFVRKKYD